MSGKKIAIVGGRTFKDYAKLCRVLEPYKEFCGLEICGCANGADKLGKKWAKENDIPIAYYPADWDKFGKSAGYIRNSAMATSADFIVAFWDGESRGTKHMIDLCLEKEKNILIIFF